MERIRRLLEILDFHVSVSDGPDQRPATDVAKTKIDEADFLVVLLGPDFSDPNHSKEPARWPYDEAVYAHARNKPIALIVHPGTPLHLLGQLQTPAKFDFQDPVSYADSVHNVVRHLLDTKRRLELPPGDLPYYYSRVSFRFAVTRHGYIEHEVYHHIVARQPWSVLSHSVDTGPDLAASSRIVIVNKDDIELEPTFGSVAHSLTVTWGESTPHAQKYQIIVDPPLPAGGQIGYRRRFELENYFPLTAEALRDRASEPGFPAVFHQGGILFYGVAADVTSEMELLSVALAFPARTGLSSHRSVAVVTRSNEINEHETKRINGGDALAKTQALETGGTTIQLNVVRPLAAHSYLLLYEPATTTAGASVR